MNSENDADLLQRLRAEKDSGRRALGGGNITSDGRVETWGGEPIMVPRNPDGLEAAALIERLSAALASQGKDRNGGEG